MDIVTTPDPCAVQKDAVYRLWNAEYPAQLTYNDMGGLEAYLAHAGNASHYFAMLSEVIAGRAFVFTRENDRWFA